LEKRFFAVGTAADRTAAFGIAARTREFLGRQLSVAVIINIEQTLGYTKKNCQCNCQKFHNCKTSRAPGDSDFGHKIQWGQP